MRSLSRSTSSRQVGSWLPCVRHGDYTAAGKLPSVATPGLGVWHRVDGHTYSAVSEVFIFSSAGAWIQTHRLTRVIEVSNDANEFSDTISLEIFNPTGNLIATGCGTTVASRLE